MFDDCINIMLLTCQIFHINVIAIDTNVSLDNLLRIISENLFRLSAITTLVVALVQAILCLRGFLRQWRNNRVSRGLPVFTKWFVILGNLEKQHLLEFSILTKSSYIYYSLKCKKIVT